MNLLVIRKRRPFMKFPLLNHLAGAIIFSMAMALYGINDAYAVNYCYSGSITGGQDTINESDSNIQFTFTCSPYGGSLTGPVIWLINSGGAYASIDSSGRLTPKPINDVSSVQVRLQAYDNAAGSSFSSYRTITINNNVVTLKDATYSATSNYQSGNQLYLNVTIQPILPRSVISGLIHFIKSGLLP